MLYLLYKSINCVVIGRYSMNKSQLLEAVADTAFVTKDECERVLVSFEKVLTEEITRKVKKFCTIFLGVSAVIGIIAAIFYFLGKSNNNEVE